MRKLILLILIISCVKTFRHIDNFKYKDINKDLVLAINDKDEYKVKRLIEEGANINFVYENRTLLELALDEEPNLDIIKILIEKGSKFSEENIIKIYDIALNSFNFDLIDVIRNNYKLEEKQVSRDKYFLYLCYTSNAKEVEKFIKENNIDPKEIKDRDGRNGLIISAIGFKRDILKIFIDRYEFDINYKDHLDKSALINLLIRINSINTESKTTYLNILDDLIASGANVNDKTYNNKTALMLASEGGHIEVVNKLLEEGANINLENFNGKNALMLAGEESCIEIVKILIKAGANINGKDEIEAIDLAFASKVGYIEEVNKLIALGFDVNEAWYEKETALMLATRGGYIEVVNKLLEAGANVSIQNSFDGKTALILASEGGHVEVVNKLLEVGANVNEVDLSRRTALMLASEWGHIEIVNKLLEEGANVNLKTFNGKTALMLASGEGHIEVIDKLIETGANVNEKDKNGVTVLIYAYEMFKKERGKFIEVSDRIIRKMSEDYIQLFISLSKNIEIPQDIKDTVHNHISLLYSLRRLPRELFEKIIERHCYTECNNSKRLW